MEEMEDRRLRGGACDFRRGDKVPRVGGAKVPRIGGQPSGGAHMRKSPNGKRWGHGRSRGLARGRRGLDRGGRVLVRVGGEEGDLVVKLEETVRTVEVSLS